MGFIMGIWDLYPIDDGCLMISSGMKNYPLYIGDYDDPRKGNPELNQPGFNGMIEGFISHCSCHVSPKMPINGSFSTAVNCGCMLVS